MIKQQITADFFLPVFKRGKQVMLAIFDDSNHLYLARKHAYPAGIYRLFGGGVDVNETFNQAAKRELKEETGLSLSPQTVEVFQFDLHESSTHQHFIYTAKLYHIQLQHHPIIPADDVDECKSFNPTQAKQQIKLYQHLTNQWRTWGQIFGQITQFVLN
jgi:8-oxo-dGTP pyrophosphatase MutT (NUDIX family)